MFRVQFQKLKHGGIKLHVSSSVSYCSEKAILSWENGKSAAVYMAASDDWCCSDDVEWGVACTFPLEQAHTATSSNMTSNKFVHERY